MDRFSRLQCAESIHIGRLAERIVNHRAFAADIFQIHSHGLQHRQQIRKQNGRVDTQDFPRRHGHFTGQLRCGAQLNE